MERQLEQLVFSREVSLFVMSYFLEVSDFLSSLTISIRNTAKIEIETFVTSKFSVAIMQTSETNSMQRQHLKSSGITTLYEDL